MRRAGGVICARAMARTFAHANAVRAGAAGCALALVLGLGALAGMASAAPTITEYTPGNPAEYHEPLSIVSAPGGADALWFTVKSPSGLGEASLSAGAVEKFSKYATLTEESPEIVDGPKDDLWATVDGATPGVIWGAASAIAESGSAEGSLTRLLDKPVGIATGPEGDVWLTEQTGIPAVVQYDPSTEQVLHTYTAGMEAGGKPGQMVLGSDGDLWFVEDGGHAAIDRIEPASGAIARFPTKAANSEPAGLAPGPEGDIWFTELHADRVGRVTPSGEITEFGESSTLTQGEPAGIVAGDDGDLYFTERGKEGAIGQITPTGTITITELTPANSGLTKNNKPWAITTGPEGDVWFTEIGGEAKIGRLTIAPGIASTSATTPSASAVQLEASVLPNLQESELSFDYGTTTPYESATSTVSVGKGVTASPAAVELKGLAPATEYHYLAVAKNASGTTDGPDETFTTAAAPTEPSEPPSETPKATPGESSPEDSQSGEDPPTDTPSAGSRTPSSLGGQPSPTPLATLSPPSLLRDPSSSSPPAPMFGRSGVVGVTTGTVTWLDPRTGLYEPVSAATDLPFGTSIDAQDGVVALTTALPGGHTQTAQVWGGTFWFAQSSHGDGQTELYLSGPLGPCPAGAGAAGASASGARASAARERAKRQLWSKDSHGHYTTHGANSAATVLGTEWLTVDSCTGTLTRVREGRVRVRDLHTGRATIVSAGHSYLARS